MKEKRQQKFEALKHDAWYGPLFHKLKSSGQEYCLDFIEHNGELALPEWEMAVNRMFLDQPTKPANWTLIQEFLTVSGKV